MKNYKNLFLTLTNGLKSSLEKKFFGPNLEKNLLKNRLSIRIRNFAPLNEPLNICKIFIYFNPEAAHTWCKNQENPSDRISHAWAPFKYVQCMVFTARRD
jgi:hypothetical protein